MKLNYQSVHLGLTDYAKAQALQLQYHASVISGGEPAVLFLQHPSVITLGKRASKENDLTTQQEELTALSIQVAHVDRGGEATLHSPGQLVVYPILPIKAWQVRLRSFIEALLETTKQAFAKYGVEAYVDLCKPGVYVDGLKCAFVGLRIERGVVRHGLSVNLNNDLSVFNHIKPCGQSLVQVCSLSQILDAPVDMGKFTEVWDKIFKQKLNKL